MKNGCIRDADGDGEWYVEDKLHREDGPAIEFNEYKAWYIEDKLHRLDGPAVEYSDGGKLWWVEGVARSEEEFNELTRDVEGDDVFREFCRDMLTI